jgi:hypothetical protein
LLKYREVPITGHSEMGQVVKLRVACERHNYVLNKGRPVNKFVFGVCLGVTAVYDKLNYLKVSLLVVYVHSRAQSHDGPHQRLLK